MEKPPKMCFLPTKLILLQGLWRLAFADIFDSFEEMHLQIGATLQSNMAFHFPKQAEVLSRPVPLGNETHMQRDYSSAKKDSNNQLRLWGLPKKDLSKPLKPPHRMINETPGKQSNWLRCISAWHQHLSMKLFEAPNASVQIGLFTGNVRL